MKQLIYSLIICISLVGCKSQQKPTIEGTGNVISDSENIAEPFNRVIIDEHIHVELRKGNRNSYVLTADDNIIPYINIEASGGTLEVNSTHHIKKKKRLELVLTVTELKSMVLRKESTLETREKYIADTLDLQTYDESTFEIDVNINHMNIKMHNKSEGELEGQSNQLYVTMTDRSELEVEQVCDVLDIRLNEKADLELDGRGNEASITVNDRARLRGRRCEIDNAKVTITHKGEVALEVSDQFTLNAKNKAMMHLYGSPEVDVESLSDGAQIEKKD